MPDKEFYKQIAANAEKIEPQNAWPASQIALCRSAGIFNLLIPGNSTSMIRSAPKEPAEESAEKTVDHATSVANDWVSIQTYIEIAKNCLTTAFILTQRQAAVARIAASSNTIAKQRWLPGLFAGESFATVGISHLTTSRQHVTKPVLTVDLLGKSLGYNSLADRPLKDGPLKDGLVAYSSIAAGSQIEINGYSPWVTGAALADVIVLGATLRDGKQVLVAVDSKLPGVVPGTGMDLTALSSSKTDQVRFERVLVDSSNILFGPTENVMRMGRGGGAGSLQTSALAIGLSLRAVEYLLDETRDRPDLRAPSEQLESELNTLLHDLKNTVCESASDHFAVTPEQIRQRANSLVLRATQSTLMVAKGAGYMKGHPAERWCREALFFLVWSCPKSVSNANLCEFAQR